MGELRAEAPVARSQCGFPGCSKRDDQVRMQLNPNDFLGTVFPGAKHFHRKRAECVRPFSAARRASRGASGRRCKRRAASPLEQLFATNRARRSLRTSRRFGPAGKPSPPSHTPPACPCPLTADRRAFLRAEPATSPRCPWTSEKILYLRDGWSTASTAPFFGARRPSTPSQVRGGCR